MISEKRLAEYLQASEVHIISCMYIINKCTTDFQLDVQCLAWAARCVGRRARCVGTRPTVGTRHLR